MSGRASGPSEPHLPDTARLRRPLRTTQETGQNHSSPGWTKLVQSTEPARFTSDRENWTRTTNAEKQESAKTKQRPRGKLPKERHGQRKHQTGDNHRHTRKDANRPRDKSEPKTGRERLGQIRMGFDVSDIVGCLLTRDVSDIVVCRLDTVLGSSR